MAIYSWFYMFSLILQISEQSCVNFQQSKDYKKLIQTMQVQRHLFRVSDRAFKQPQLKTSCWIGFLASCSFSIFFALIFVFASSPMNTDTNLLWKCYNSTIQKRLGKDGNTISMSLLQLNRDQIWTIYSQKFEPLKSQQIGDLDNNLEDTQQQNSEGTQKQYKGNIAIVNNDYCAIYRNLPYNLTVVKDPILQFARSRGLLSLSIEQRTKLDIKNYTIMLNYGIIQNYFIQTEAILIKELIQMKELMTVSANSDEKPYFKTSRAIYSPSYFKQQQKDTPSKETNQTSGRLLEFLSLFLVKLYKISKIIFFYVLVSVGTSMYVYATIVSAPGLIMIILSCTRFNQGDNMTDVYKIFPWIGLHAMIRRTAGHPEVKKSTIAVCGALLCYFLVTYLLYYAVIIKANSLMFGLVTESGVQQLFFSFMALIEFSTIIFMRTRPFIKYYPKIHSLLMIGFLIYCEFTSLGYKKLMLNCIIGASFGLFLWMVIRTQLPASTEWNKARHYTPTIDRPRIGMSPIFNMSWMNSLPEQWSRFIPLQGRQNFSVEQLSLVDKNYEALDNALQANQA